MMFPAISYYDPFGPEGPGWYAADGRTTWREVVTLDPPCGAGGDAAPDDHGDPYRGVSGAER